MGMGCGFVTSISIHPSLLRRRLRQSAQATFSAYFRTFHSTHQGAIWIYSDMRMHCGGMPFWNAFSCSRDIFLHFAEKPSLTNLTFRSSSKHALRE